MAQQVPWDQRVLDEFIRQALLSEEDQWLMRTRAAGWSRVQQCHAYGMSLATLDRYIRKLKNSYNSVQEYSYILPQNIDF